MEPNEAEVNIQDWGLKLSAPNPFGQQHQHDVRCVWKTCCRPGPLLFILYWIAFPGTATELRRLRTDGDFLNTKQWLLGIFSNDNSDGNLDVKKAIGL